MHGHPDDLCLTEEASSWQPWLHGAELMKADVQTGIHTHDAVQTSVINA